MQVMTGCIKVGFKFDIKLYLFTKGCINIKLNVNINILS